ncbi:MAG: hypothetical protein HY554_16260 [Elusimicrobia bacterium]|nr:hypothetical protein [Elusimicrobiota bacterium]
MTNNPLYRLYGLAVLGAMAYALHFGWSWTSVDEVKSVPKSVRDNPGAYRAHYRSHSRYYGGK